MGHTGEFELLVLLAVRRLDDDAYGVSVLQELEDRTSRTLTLGTIYKTLSRLVAKGFLDTQVAAPTGERGGRRKKLYALTDAGLEAAQKSLDDLRRLTDGLAPDLETP